MWQILFLVYHIFQTRGWGYFLKLKEYTICEYYFILHVFLFLLMEEKRAESISCYYSVCPVSSKVFLWSEAIFFSWYLYYFLLDRKLSACVLCSLFCIDNLQIKWTTGLLKMTLIRVDIHCGPASKELSGRKNVPVISITSVKFDPIILSLFFSFFSLLRRLQEKMISIVPTVLTWAELL